MEIRVAPPRRQNRVDPQVPQKPRWATSLARYQTSVSSRGQAEIGEGRRRCREIMAGEFAALGAVTGNNRAQGAIDFKPDAATMAGSSLGFRHRRFPVAYSRTNGAKMARFRRAALRLRQNRPAGRQKCSRVGDTILRFFPAAERFWTATQRKVKSSLRPSGRRLPLFLCQTIPALENDGWLKQRRQRKPPNLSQRRACEIHVAGVHRYRPGRQDRRAWPGSRNDNTQPPGPRVHDRDRFPPHNAPAETPRPDRR